MKYVVPLILSVALVSSFAANPLAIIVERDRAAGVSLYDSTAALDNQGASPLDSLRVRSQCRSVLNQGTTLEPLEGRPATSISPAQKNAHEQLRKTCIGFTASDLTAARTKEIETRATQSGDSQYAAFKRFISASNSLQTFTRESRSNALRDVFLLQDPTLLSELGLRMFIYPSEGKGNFVWFSGVQYLLKDDPEIAYSVKLIQCDFGAACNENDFEVLSLCASSGVCYSDRKAMVMDQAKSAGKSVELVNKLRSEISSAIKLQRVSSFIKP